MAYSETQTLENELDVARNAIDEALSSTSTLQDEIDELKLENHKLEEQICGEHLCNTCEAIVNLKK